MNLEKIKRNPWPYAIIAYFVVFITAMACWVVVAMRNNMELVRKDYYEHEIQYQRQIDKAKRTAALGREISITYKMEDNLVEITLPRNENSEPQGIITFYRPSDARLDRSIPVAIDHNGKQLIATGGLEGGLWRVQVSWKAGEEDYYFERPVVLGPGG